MRNVQIKALARLGSELHVANECNEKAKTALQQCEADGVPRAQLEELLAEMTVPALEVVLRYGR